MDNEREEVATLQINVGEHEEAVVIVGILRNHRRIALAISSRENGDAEIHLDPEDCNKVVEYLRKGITQLSRDTAF
jgi:hypothetical protein